MPAHSHQPRFRTGPVLGGKPAKIVVVYRPAKIIVARQSMNLFTWGHSAYLAKTAVKSYEI